MHLTLVTPPDVEPVSLEEAKAHCRVDSSDDDTVIEALIIAARRLCENYCYRGFITQTWKLEFDISEWSSCVNYVKLPFGTVQSITTIKTYDTDNVFTTFSSSNYRLSNNRAVLNDGSSWPTLERTYDAIEITYVVGFGDDAADVPQDIKQAILFTVAHFYENREALMDPITGNTEQQVMLPFGVSALLQTHRTNFI